MCYCMGLTYIWAIIQKILTYHLPSPPPSCWLKFVCVNCIQQCTASTVQDRSGKCLTEERQILNRWTEYCSELYNYKASGDPSVLNCPQTDTQDDHPILCKELEAAVQSLKKGRSAWLDNIPAELVQVGGEDVITALTTICNKTCSSARTTEQ